MSLNKKIVAAIAGNFLGAGAQVAVPTTNRVEAYLRIVLLVLQIIIGVVTAIWAYRRLQKPPDDE